MSTTIFRNVKIGYNDVGDLLTFQVPIKGMPRIPAGANPRDAKQNKAVKAMEAGMMIENFWASKRHIKGYRESRCLRGAPLLSRARWYMPGPIIVALRGAATTSCH